MPDVQGAIDKLIADLGLAENKGVNDLRNIANKYPDIKPTDEALESAIANALDPAWLNRKRLEITEQVKNVLATGKSVPKKNTSALA